jgi:hypothetical protein
MFLSGGQNSDRDAEFLHRPVEQHPVGVGAAGDDLHPAAEQAQGESGEEGTSSRLRRATIDAVAS